MKLHNYNEVMESMDEPTLQKAVEDLRQIRADDTRRLRSLAQGTADYDNTVKDLQLAGDTLRSILSRLAAIHRGQRLVPVDKDGLVARFFTPTGQPTPLMRQIIEQQDNGEGRALMNAILSLAAYTADATAYLATQGQRSVNNLTQDPATRAYTSIVNSIAKAADRAAKGGQFNPIAIDPETLNQAKQHSDWSRIQDVTLSSVLRRGALIVQDQAPKTGDALAQQYSEVMNRLEYLQNQPETDAIVQEMSALSQKAANLRKQVKR